MISPLFRLIPVSIEKIWFGKHKTNKGLALWTLLLQTFFRLALHVPIDFFLWWKAHKAEIECLNNKWKNSIGRREESRKKRKKKKKSIGSTKVKTGQNLDWYGTLLFQLIFFLIIPGPWSVWSVFGRSPGNFRWFFLPFPSPSSVVFGVSCSNNDHHYVRGTEGKKLTRPKKVQKSTFIIIIITIVHILFCTHPDIFYLFSLFSIFQNFLWDEEPREGVWECLKHPEFRTSGGMTPEKASLRTNNEHTQGEVWVGVENMAELLQHWDMAKGKRQENSTGWSKS